MPNGQQTNDEQTNDDEMTKEWQTKNEKNDKRMTNHCWQKNVERTAMNNEQMTEGQRITTQQQCMMANTRQTNGYRLSKD